jgi:hypothetical protein
LGACNICELDRKAVAHVVAREAGAEIQGEPHVKLSSRKLEKFVGVDDDIDTEQIVIRDAAAYPTPHICEWVHNEEQCRLNSVSSKFGTIAEPIAEKIFFTELIAFSGC